MLPAKAVRREHHHRQRAAQSAIGQEARPVTKAFKTRLEGADAARRLGRLLRWLGEQVPEGSDTHHG